MTLNAKDVLEEAQQMLRDLKQKICRDCKQVKKLVQSGRCAECQVLLMEKKSKDREGKRLVQESGYVYVYDENDKLVLEHRQVMEKHLGRKLTKKEIVIHVNEDKGDNNISNLILAFKAGIPLDKIKCNSCGTIGDFSCG